jgi:hypothetical protein
MLWNAVCERVRLKTVDSKHKTPARRLLRSILARFRPWKGQYRGLKTKTPEMAFKTIEPFLEKESALDLSLRLPGLFPLP